MLKPFLKAHAALLAGLLALLVPAAPAAAQDILLDFDRGALGDVLNVHGRIEAWRTEAPAGAPPGVAGTQSLAVRTRGNSAFSLKDGLPLRDLSNHDTFRMWVWRAPERAGQEDRIAVRFSEEQFHANYWRRFVLTHTGWEQFEVPLMWFRHGDGRIARWEDMSNLSIHFDSPAEIVFDNIEILNKHEHGPHLELSALEELAFPGAEPGTVRTVVRGNAAIITDDPRVDAEELAERLDRQGRALLEQFAEVSFPIRHPAPLVIFADDEDYRSFVPRLGEALAAVAPRPQSDGYTLNGIALSTWSDQFGMQRPVWTHEWAHALLHQALLLPPRSDWFHEALANTFQLEHHPQESFAGIVRQGARNANRKPFQQVFGGDVIQTTDYWQVVAFWDLLANHPEWSTRKNALIREFQKAGSVDLGPHLGPILNTTWRDIENAWTIHCAFFGTGMRPNLQGAQQSGTGG